MKLVKQASGKTTIKMSKNDWKSIGKIAGWMDDYDEVDLGSTPTGEECVQVGEEDYYKWNRIELIAYVNQLKRQFPDMPRSLKFKISSNPHDFGTYHEVVVRFNADNEEDSNYAWNMQNSLPEYWDETAKNELKEKGYPYLSMLNEE